MTLETLYALSFLPAAPFWLLMIALPHWAWAKRIIASPLIVVPSALFYLAMMVAIILQPTTGELDLFSLAGLADAFGQPNGALVVWLHMIAVDLIAGRWAYLDSRERGISAWIMAPVLIAILSAAPLGLLIYLGVRGFYLGRRGKGESTDGTDKQS